MPANYYLHVLKTKLLFALAVEHVLRHRSHALFVSERIRILHINQRTEFLDAGNWILIHVIEDACAVLHEIAEHDDIMPREIRNRNGERAARHIHAPGIVHLEVRELGRDVQAFVRQLANGRTMRLQISIEIGCAILVRLDHIVRVARRKKIGAVVIGVEKLRGMKAGCRRERAAAPQRSRSLECSRIIFIVCKEEDRTSPYCPQPR